jgi:DNA-binding PadR family transcriptional regulator
MATRTDQDLKRTILEALDQASREGLRKAHKMTIIGRGDGQAGTIEYRLSVELTAKERSRAARTFEQLKRDGYLEATLDDLVDPENWVAITDAGVKYLQRNMRDHIDEHLNAISAHLVELRKGMWDALDRTSPDAVRQAANSARELIDQLLKEGAPPELKTQRARFVHLMRAGDKDKEVSKGDLKIIQASFTLIEAVRSKLLSEVHARRSVQPATVRSCVEAAENILQLVFTSDKATEDR